MISDGEHSFRTKGSCARTITYTAKDGKIFNIRFDGGCNGNLKMISKLLEGMDAEEIVSKCKGNLCGLKGTSCADQLARALISEE
ncbi:MAG: TIGR03905 family TSCPD domain-containing protein [Treponema sp.]|nr:TIGR03905 family TSCPD domain-containing protein [Treponema sp.]